MRKYYLALLVISILLARFISWIHRLATPYSILPIRKASKTTVAIFPVHGLMHIRETRLMPIGDTHAQMSTP
jgi:hypothetical protein